MTKTRLLMISGVLALFVVMTVPKIHTVKEAAGGALVWNGDKAYAFVKVVSRGWRVNLLGYMLEYPREFFGGVVSPDDESIRTIVLDLSSQQVHEFSQDNFDFSPLVVNDNIFGSVMKNGEFETWKWTGAGFSEATTEERRALEQQQSSENLSGHPKGTDYYNVHGWSEKSIFNANLRTEKLMADVPTTAFTVVSKKLETLYTIDVLRQGRSPERIWTLQGYPHIVSRVEYRRIFHIN
jgi:hypothetical protein